MIVFRCIHQLHALQIQSVFAFLPRWYSLMRLAVSKAIDVHVTHEVRLKLNGIRMFVGLCLIQIKDLT